MLEIDGGPGERWGLAILSGEIVAVEQYEHVYRKDGDGERLSEIQWRRMSTIPAKLADYIGPFCAQNFALLTRRGIPQRPPPAAAASPE